MDFNEFFRSEPIELQAKDRWQAIDELTSALVSSKKIKPRHSDAIAAAVKKRESAMSTGIGYRIGLPHASTDLVSEFVVVAGRSPTGIQFDALDGQTVKLVVLFLVPQGQFQDHSDTLAQIAKWLHWMH